MKLLLLGAGGHAKAVIEVARASGNTIVGLVAEAPASTHVLGVPVLGGDSDLPRLRAEGIEAIFIAIGDNATRHHLSRHVRDLGFALPSLLHPSAIISPSSTIGDGVVAMPLAVVGAETLISDLVILNSAAIVEHDGRIASAAHLAPGAVLAGDVQVGERTLVGVGAVVRPGIRIGADAVIGAGAAVVADVRAGARVLGVPARARGWRSRDS
jgi:UDP-perosamine 4-acetyltransferase